MTTMTVLLGLSFALNVWLCGLYRTERKRRSLMCECVRLHPKADWLPLYERMHRLVIQVEGPEEY
jgi:hypothetical protein